MKHALLAASLVLVAGTTVGCGGGAPTDASTDDFCGVFDDFYKTASELGADAEDSEVIKALKETGEKLEEVGTPEDMPDDAREGFELTVETIAELDEDATQEDLEKLEEEFSAEEKKKSDAFDKYLEETCSDPAEEPGELPTDLPTEEPSE